MTKIPTAPHPVEQLTTSELVAYISQLRAALQSRLTQADRDVVLGRIGEAYKEANERNLKV